MTGDIKQRKKIIRQQYLRIRDAVSADELRVNSETITGHLLGSAMYADCAEVFVYNSMRSEVITSGIISAALTSGRVVALPVTTPTDLTFVRITSTDGLIKSSFGVYEPALDANRVVRAGPRTLVIAPGAVFASDGRRIGYGGGYYDRYLSENTYMAAVGLCIDAQLCDDVPADAFDVRMDYIITESGVIGI